MSQEALKLLKEIEWEYDGVYRRCRLCLHDPHRENCPHVRLLSLLESQPEPGQLTKEILAELDAGAKFVSPSVMLEACDLIDRLTEENEELRIEVEELQNG